MFYHDPEIRSLQGLDFGKDRNFIFISDYTSGVYKLDLINKTKIPVVVNFKNVTMKSIDGLYYYDGSLIATQNLLVPMRVTRYYLNEVETEFTRFEYIEKANPVLNEPTLGVIVDNTFYFVANSQWAGYDNNNDIFPLDKLKDIIILKASLN